MYLSIEGNSDRNDYRQSNCTNTCIRRQLRKLCRDVDGKIAV